MKGLIGLFLALVFTLNTAVADEPAHCTGEYAQLMASIGTYQDEEGFGTGALFDCYVVICDIRDLQTALDNCSEFMMTMPDYGLEGDVTDIQEKLDSALSEINDALGFIGEAQNATATGLTWVLLGKFDKAHVCWGVAETKLENADGCIQGGDMDCNDAASMLDDLWRVINEYLNPEDPDPEDPEEP